MISGSILLLILLTAENELVSGCSSSNKDAETENETETDNELRTGFKGISCPYGEHECNDGKGCYTNAQKCDGTNDCKDGSDEDNHHCGKIVIFITKVK